MTSRTTRSFRQNLRDLPEAVRRQARSAYLLFRENPRHPSLQFKLVHDNLPVYSVRVSRGYRAVGVLTRGLIVWYFIGSHADYDRLLRRL